MSGQTWRNVVMDKDVRIEMSLGDLCQLLETFRASRTDSPVGLEQLGSIGTVDDHIRERWWLATPKDRRRIRDVFLAKYRQKLNRDPLKLSGHLNAAFVVEQANLPILDEAIDLVRNEVEAKRHTPLFN